MTNSLFKHLGWKNEEECRSEDMCESIEVYTLYISSLQKVTKDKY